jgi:hypothetical protein
MLINPEALSESVHQQEMLCARYLHILYHDMPDIQVNPPLNHANIPETPGEILHQSVSRILTKLRLTEKDVFMDLGSGLGKIVAQVFLQTAVKEAIGIEIVSAFHERALLAAGRLRQELPDFFQNERQLTYLCGSFLELPVNIASVVLINAICFDPFMVRQLGALMESTPNIHTVIALRPLPGLQRLRFQKTLRVECSWDSALCYLYHN